MSRALHKFLSVLLFTWLSAPSLAGIITVPPGLAPGTQYRLVFVTDGTRDAVPDTIDAYNSFVTTQAGSSADLLALGTTWRVIGSSFGDNVDARDNTSTVPGTDGAGIPIYLVSGDKVADNYADLWDGSIDHAINVTQSGLTKAPGTLVWTGTQFDGTQDVFGTLGSDFPATGVASATNGDWITDGDNASSVTFQSASLSFYAMSGLLTVPVPEPGTFVFAGVLSCIVIAVHFFHRRRNHSRSVVP